MSEERSGNRRPSFWKRQFIVNPRFQYVVIVWFMVIFLTAQGLLYFGFFHVMQSFSQQFVAGTSADSMVVAGFIEEQNIVMSKIFLQTSIFIGLVIFIVGILFSHRVAGPLHRLRLQLTRMKENGRLEKVSFREGDYFSEVATEFNAVVDRVAERPD